MQVLLGVIFHLIGGFASGSFYMPYSKVRGWAWESYWIIGGSAGVLIGIAFAAITNLVSWYQSDKIALAAYRARPISPQQAPGLYQMVQRLCDRARLPMPALYVIPSNAANAFATGRDPEHAAVAVTQ